MAVPRKKDQLGRLQGEIQELIDELWQVPRFSGLRRGFRPQIDVIRIADPPRFRVVVELAGVDPEQEVTLYCDASTLVVAGERKRESRGRYFHMEIEYGPFERRIDFSDQVDPSRASAEYDRGLLTIVLPVAERAPVQERVTIMVGGGL
jgi:HSP20 family protein